VKRLEDRGGREPVSRDQQLPVVGEEGQLGIQLSSVDVPRSSGFPLAPAP
jgi:hypothetical protein